MWQISIQQNSEPAERKLLSMNNFKSIDSAPRQRLPCLEDLPARDKLPKWPISCKPLQWSCQWPLSYKRQWGNAGGGAESPLANDHTARWCIIKFPRGHVRYWNYHIWLWNTIRPSKMWRGGGQDLNLKQMWDGNTIEEIALMRIRFMMIGRWWWWRRRWWWWHP